MSAGSTRLWQELEAEGEVAMAGRVSLLQCSDWVRLLVGKSLATSQCSDGTWRYLVQGVPSADLMAAGDERGVRLSAMAVKADFQHLRESIEELKRRMAGSPADFPETFLRSFHLLWSVNLPVDPRAWLVTDEGLAIVQWGLRSGRQLFEWSPGQLQAMESACLSRIGQEAMVEAAGASRARVSARRRVSMALEARAGDGSAPDVQDDASVPVSAAVWRWAREPLLWSALLLAMAMGAAGGHLLAMRRVARQQETIPAPAPDERTADDGTPHPEGAPSRKAGSDRDSEHTTEQGHTP